MPKDGIKQTGLGSPISISSEPNAPQTYRHTHTPQVMEVILKLRFPLPKVSSGLCLLDIPSQYNVLLVSFNIQTHHFKP